MNEKVQNTLFFTLFMGFLLTIIICIGQQNRIDELQEMADFQYDKTRSLSSWISDIDADFGKFESEVFYGEQSLDSRLMALQTRFYELTEINDYERQDDLISDLYFLEQINTISNTICRLHSTAYWFCSVETHD